MAGVSVVICTHNPREEYLRRTLEALRAQTMPMDQWELLIIDNASGKKVDSHTDLSWHPRGRIMGEEKLGKMMAWQRGMQEAGEDILVFVDDDNVLAPDYLEQVMVIAEEWPFIGAWGASVIPEFESLPPSWCKDHMWRLSIEEVRDGIWSNLREGFETKPMGAGMCVRRAVANCYLEWCRTHEESNMLDRQGTVITGYGDMNLAQCAIDIGLGTGKSPRLKVTHLIPSTRLALDYFLRHAEGDAASFLMYREIRGLPIQEPTDSLKAKIKRSIYRLVSGKPEEFFQIEAAHRRGLKIGWAQVQAYREKMSGKAIVTPRPFSS